MIPPKGSIPNRSCGSPSRRNHFEVSLEKWKPHTFQVNPVKKAISHSLKAILQLKLNELIDCEKLLREGNLGSIETSLQRYVNILKKDIERIRREA